MAASISLATWRALPEEAFRVNPFDERRPRATTHYGSASMRNAAPAHRVRTCDESSCGLHLEREDRRTTIALLTGLRVPHARRRPRALEPRRLQRVLDYIEEHLDTALPLATLAAVACQSPFHFSRAFRAAIGQPPHQYVMERRVEHAKRVLVDAAPALAAIAAHCGFSSQAHFTRCFKRLTGATPGAYRARACAFECRDQPRGALR